MDNMLNRDFSNVYAYSIIRIQAELKQEKEREV